MYNLQHKMGAVRNIIYTRKVLRIRKMPMFRCGNIGIFATRGSFTCIFFRVRLVSVRLIFKPIILHSHKFYVTLLTKHKTINYYEAPDSPFFVRSSSSTEL